MDDAYIVQHAVKGILLGKELSFIGGNPFDGITSPLDTLLISGFSLIMPIKWAQFLLSFISEFLTIVGFFYICKTQNLSNILSISIAVFGFFQGKCCGSR